MTKDVLIAIKGMQFEGETDPEEIEVIQRGQYFERNGSHYLLYDEPVEGTSDIIKNRIKFKENEVQVAKKGAVNTTLTFTQNEKNMTNYATPFGNLVIGIDTQKIALDMAEEKMGIRVDYALDINYAFLADCKISIEVSALPS